MTELKAMNAEPSTVKEEDPVAGTSGEPESPAKHSRGFLQDRSVQRLQRLKSWFYFTFLIFLARFTRDVVVVSSNAKAKSSYELQLPSMTALTSKTSSQAFFLRLLKVIMTLRDL